MSSLSDLIAEFINSALESAGGETELRRADIASQFDCVPSQVNYVLTSRFTPGISSSPAGAAADTSGSRGWGAASRF